MFGKKKKINIDFLSNIKDNFLDSDNDGLTNAVEKRLGTNPNCSDTDNDQLDDYLEVKVYHTDPCNPDSDEDGMCDGEEIKTGRNPNGPGFLKDYFIPHAGNDYLPKSLLPKRLLYYGLFAFAIKIIILSLALSFPMDAWLNVDVSEKWKDRIIALTNQERKTRSLPPLKENKTLNKAAYAKVQDMLIGQYFDHISPAKKGLKDWLALVKYNFSTAGENLALGFDDPDDLIKAWLDSPSHYANIIDPDYKDIGTAVISGNYMGADTFLASQYFGSAGEAKIEAKSEKIPPRVNTTYNQKNKDLKAAPTKPSSKTAESKPATTTIAKKNDPDAAPKPSLNFSSKENPTNKKFVNFSINAPGAKQTIVYVNGGIVAAEKILADNPVYKELEMEEGTNEIIASAIYDSKKIFSDPYSLTIDLTPPQIDLGKTDLVFRKLNGNDSSVVAISAYLSNDTDKADLYIGNDKISMQADPTEKNVWRGKGIVYNQNDTIVPATIIAEDKAGSTAVLDVSPRNVQPQNIQAIDEYLFIKKFKPNELKNIFDISSTLYKLLLFLASLALILNILVEFKKQHPRVIASTLGLMAILILFIAI